MICTHERHRLTASGAKQCADCGSIEIRLDSPCHAIWITLDDPRGCYAYMGYLGQSLHCGIHGLCAKCREWTGDAPSKVALENRRKELDRWMRAELPGLGLSDADVLGATETSYSDSQGEKPRPELVRVRRDTDPSFENIVALGSVQS